MKTIAPVLFLTSALALPAAGQITEGATSLSGSADISAGLDTPEPIVAPAGPHHRVLSPEPPPGGGALDATTLGQTRGRVVELATGLNFWDGTTWSRSRAFFEAAPAGDAILASQVQHKIRLSPDLNVSNAVVLALPDGTTLSSTPAAIGLSDAAGTTIVIGLITNCEARLLSTNKVIYENAFSGVCADLVFTITQDSFEQDVVFTGKVDPTEFGLSTDFSGVQLHIYTEFFQCPTPAAQQHPIWFASDPLAQRSPIPDLVDEFLSFGNSLASRRARPTLKVGQASRLSLRAWPPQIRPPPP